jgi:alpha-beta hydrolase superfamily lysophospholipase
MKMREVVARFGSGAGLAGIFTEPDAALRSTARPNVLLWNVGIHHRIGPNRIFVDLARELARRGFTCLRFDLSGLGDSETNRTDARSDVDRACADIRAAMQHSIERTGSRGVLLIAFCSGVDAAHAVSTSDANVVGLVNIEGYRYPTPRFYARYPMRFLDTSRWDRLLRLRFPKLLPEEVRDFATSTGARETVFVRELVEQSQFREDIRRMISRGTKLLYIYAGRDSTYSYRDQLLDALDSAELREALDIEYYPEADHLFFIQRDRDKVVRNIALWAQRLF